tara:strand:- start:43 stop:720 length:678 start_codon:yes stop_codon:yes gene_type:complete
MPSAGKWKEKIGWETIEDWHIEAGGFTKDGGTLTITEIIRRCIEICGNAPSKGSISPHFNEETRKKIIERSKKYKSSIEGMLNHRLHRLDARESIEDRVVEMLPNRHENVQQLIRDRLKDVKGRNGMKAIKYVKYWEDHKGLEKVSEIEWCMPCTVCGEELIINPKGENMHLDHIVPHSRGGSGERSNIVPIHKRCNQSKADMTMEEFVELCEKVIKNNVIKNNT